MSYGVDTVLTMLKTIAAVASVRSKNRQTAAMQYQ